MKTRDPLLSLVLRPDAVRSLVPQTSSRFEVVDATAARGLWMLCWWGEDLDPLQDPALVEKAVRVAQNTPGRVCIGLTALPDGLASYRWRPLSTPSDTLLGLLVERRIAGKVAGQRPALWRGFPVSDGGRRETIPVLPAGAPWLPAALSAKLVRTLRRGRFGRQAEADWSPPDTVPLRLVEQGDGQLALALGHRVPARVKADVILGLAFTRPFWRARPLTRHSDGRGLVLDGAGSPLAYALSAGLPGMVEVRVAIDAAVRSHRRWDGHPAPVVSGDGPGWIDLPVLPPPSIWPDAEAGPE
jgi:hypothetical protein